MKVFARWARPASLLLVPAAVAGMADFHRLASAWAAMLRDSAAGVRILGWEIGHAGLLRAMGGLPDPGVLRGVITFETLIAATVLAALGLVAVGLSMPAAAQRRRMRRAMKRRRRELASLDPRLAQVRTLSGRDGWTGSVRAARPQPRRLRRVA